MPYTPGPPTRSRLPAGLTVTRGTLSDRRGLPTREPQPTPSLALQDLLGVIAEHCVFRYPHGDRDARDDLRVCRRPSLGDIGAGGPFRAQASLDRVWHDAADRAGA